MRETFDRPRLRAELERDEGRRNHVYLDTEGKRTIGVGWNLDANPIPIGVLKVLGTDWRLEDGLTEEAIDLLTDIGIDRACDDLGACLPNWRDLDPDRQRVLLNMAFNLGRQKLSMFHKMLEALEEYLNGDTESALDRAAREMLDSLWAKQVKARAIRLAARMMPHRDKAVA